jgi:hypothetical protein
MRRRKALLYIEQGLISPQVASPGIGKSWKFSLIDLMLFEFGKQLVELGIAPRFLRTVAEDISQIVRGPYDDPAECPALLYITRGDQNDTLQVSAVCDIEKCESVVIVNLAKIREKILSLFAQRAALGEAELT